MSQKRFEKAVLSICRTLFSMEEEKEKQYDNSTIS